MDILKTIIEPLLQIITKALGALFVYNAGKKSERLENAEDFAEKAIKAQKLEDAILNDDDIDDDDLDEWVRK